MSEKEKAQYKFGNSDSEESGSEKSGGEESDLD
jgi:hypothetical protein